MKRISILFSTLVMLFAAGTAAIADNYACKQECLKCSSVCKEALKHCADMGGEHADADHLKIMKDCMEACDHTAAFNGKKGSVEEYTWNDTCKKCMDACQKCADLCGSMKDDKIMQRCASQCRFCIKALKARWGYNDSIRPVPSNSR
ncbi:MAG TPA: hypothetical protein V6C97_24020 [Oculatellaceae cyanobacterium]